MTDSLKPIAFIADRLSAAHTDIRYDYHLIQTKGQRQGVVKIDGVERPFVIVQFPEHLMGLEISSFVFLPSAMRMKSMHAAEMTELARSRIRP